MSDDIQLLVNRAIDHLDGELRMYIEARFGSLEAFLTVAHEYEIEYTPMEFVQVGPPEDFKYKAQQFIRIVKKDKPMIDILKKALDDVSTVDFPNANMQKALAEELADAIEDLGFKIVKED